MAKDIYHELVKEALVNEGWTITHDPYPMEEWDPEWEIDLGAEKIIGAEKENSKIAVEVKSFLAASFAYEFHQALGQYVNYLLGLSQIDRNRVLYLAVPLDVWETEFQRKGIQFSVKEMNVKVIVYEVQSKRIKQWIE